MMYILLALLGMGIALLVINFQNIKQKLSPKAHGKVRFERTNLIPHNQREFFWRLCRALPDCYIFPRVPLASLVRISPKSPVETDDAYRAVAHRVVDFAVFDAHLRIVCVVELDKHNQDELGHSVLEHYLNAAGIMGVRWNTAHVPSVEQIAKLVLPDGGNTAPRTEFQQDMSMNTIQVMHQADPVREQTAGLTSLQLDQLTPNKAIKRQYPHIWERICLFATEPKHLHKYLASLSLQDRGKQRAGFPLDVLQEIADIQLQNDRFLPHATTSWQNGFINI